MARARIQPPEWAKDEKLAECDPLGRLLYRDLHGIADKAGRLEDRPKRIAIECLPYDPGADVVALLNQLEARRFIQRYTVSGKAYIQVVDFLTYQKPHPRETDSVIPGPTEGEPKDNPRPTEGETRLPVLKSESEFKTVGKSKSVHQPVTVKRFHENHAACFDIGPCVTQWVHDDFISRIGGAAETRDERVRAFYVDAIAALDGQPVEGTSDDFWKRRFEAMLSRLKREREDKANDEMFAEMRRMKDESQRPFRTPTPLAGRGESRAGAARSPA